MTSKPPGLLDLAEATFTAGLLGPAPLAQPECCSWQGFSGIWYRHFVLPFSSTIYLYHINYIFVRRNPDGSRTGLYNGETESTIQRFANHEKWDAARRLGANEIHTFYGGAEHDRCQIETDIRHGHQMPLNEEPVPAVVSLATLASSVAFPLGSSLADGAKDRAVRTTRALLAELLRGDSIQR